MKASSAVYAGSLLSLLPGHIPFSAIFKQDYPLQEPLLPSLFISLLQPHQIPPHSARLCLTHLWDYNKKISFLCLSPRSPVRGSENYTCSLRQEAFQHFFSLSSLTCENKAVFSKTANCESLVWASGQITGDERSGAHSGVPPFALTVTLTFPRTPIHQWHWRCARGRVCQKGKYSISHVLCDEMLWLILTVNTVSNLCDIGAKTTGWVINTLIY